MLEMVQLCLRVLVPRSFDFLSVICCILLSFYRLYKSCISVVELYRSLAQYHAALEFSSSIRSLDVRASHAIKETRAVLYLDVLSFVRHRLTCSTSVQYESDLCSISRSMFLDFVRQ
ncbi:hypothetical protein ABW19_dt0203868 [Dactylella cylindrospora]|nr:hypothetical protein ABW19_dt0203868 [Dactylella cylindrospora]